MWSHCTSYSGLGVIALSMPYYYEQDIGLWWWKLIIKNQTSLYFEEYKYEAFIIQNYVKWLYHLIQWVVFQLLNLLQNDFVEFGEGFI